MQNIDIGATNRSLLLSISHGSVVLRASVVDATGTHYVDESLDAFLASVLHSCPRSGSDVRAGRLAIVTGVDSNRADRHLNARIVTLYGNRPGDAIGRVVVVASNHIVVVVFDLELGNTVLVRRHWADILAALGGGIRDETHARIGERVPLVIVEPSCTFSFCVSV